MRGLERGELRLAMITTARYFATRLDRRFLADCIPRSIDHEVVNATRCWSAWPRTATTSTSWAASRRTWRSRPSQSRKIRWWWWRRPSSAVRRPRYSREKPGKRAFPAARAGLRHPSGGGAFFRRPQDQPAGAHDARQRRNHQAGRRRRPRPRHPLRHVLTLELAGGLLRDARGRAFRSSANGYDRPSRKPKECPRRRRRSCKC